MDKVVGWVWNPTTEQFQAVIGYKLNSKGFFQFFVIGTKEHFRKRPALTVDQIIPIPDKIYLALEQVGRKNNGFDRRSTKRKNFDR